MLPTDGGNDEAVRQEAAVWFERMRGADAERYRAEFGRWRQRDPRHAHAYTRFEDHWALAGALRTTEMGHARQLALNSAGVSRCRCRATRLLARRWPFF